MIIKSEKKEPTSPYRICDWKFEIVGLLWLPKGEFTHCAFCGCRIKYPVLLKRNDGTLWRVSRYCIGKVGLELPSKIPTAIRTKDRLKYKEVEEQPKVEEGEEDYFSLDECFED